jgi:hypothetical protein
MEMTEAEIYRVPSLLNKPSVIVIIFYTCFAICFIDFWKPINVFDRESVFENPEIVSYYSYLPSTFLNHGSFKSPPPANQRNPVAHLSSELPGHNYGLSVLYFPFFLIAQLQVTRASEYFGYSQIHAESIHLGAIIYVLLGLILLRKILLLYFTETTITITIFLVAFGSTLFYYAFSQSELPESHLFFLVCAFMRLTQVWYRKTDWFSALLMGAVLGLISLISIPDLFIMLLLFVLWNVKTWDSLRHRITFFRKRSLYLIVIALLFMALWLPQLFFNWQRTGSLFYFTNQSEWYDYSRVNIFSLLAGYQYGWITYCPLALLIVCGIFSNDKSLPLSRNSLIFALLSLLIIVSMWRGVDYYGARKMCPSIAWLSLPLAGIIQAAFVGKSINALYSFARIAIVIFILSCVFVNLGTTYRVIQKQIQTEKMTSELYWKYFMTYKFDIPNK